MANNGSFWAAYKIKMKGDNNSLVNRRVSQRIERKHRRNEEINKRRNLSNSLEEDPVSEIEAMPNVKEYNTSKKKVVKQTACNDRVELLRKWQEEKKKVLQKSDKNKKPNFKTGGIQRSEAVLFEIPQSKSGLKPAKPFKFVSKPAAIAVKECFDVDKVSKPVQRPQRGGKAVVKDAPTMTKKNTVDQGIKKSKSLGVLAQHNPPIKSDVKNEVKPPVKTTDVKPMRKFKSTVAVTELVNRPTRGTKQLTDLSKKLTMAASPTTKSDLKKKAKPTVKAQDVKPMRKFKSTTTVAEPVKRSTRGTKQHTDLSKKLTIAASSKISKPEISPKKNLRRIKSSIMKEVLPGKGGIKPVNHGGNVKNVAHQHQGGVDDNKNTEEESSDSQEGQVLSDASVPSPKHSTPHFLRSAKMSKSSSSHKSKNDALKQGKRQSKRKSMKHLSPVQVVENRLEVSYNNSDYEVQGIDVDESDKQQIILAPKMNTSTLSNNSDCHLSVDLSWTAGVSAALDSVQEEKTHELASKKIKGMASDREKPTLKSVDQSSGKKIRRSMRKSIRLAAIAQKEGQDITGNEDGKSDNISLNMSKSTPVNRQKSKLILTPSRKLESDDSLERRQRSTRRSTHTSLAKGNITSEIDSAPSSTGGENEGPREMPGSSVSDFDNKISLTKKTPKSAKKRNINSSLAEPPVVSSLLSQEMNAISLEDESRTNGEVKSLKHPRRKSMRMLTYNEPEVIDLKDDITTPRKRKCMTPSSLVKSFSELACNNAMNQRVSNDVDDVTPVSGKKPRIQSGLDKRRSQTPSVNINDNFTVTRSAGKTSLIDRRSTARGRRSRRMTAAATLSMEEQVATGSEEKVSAAHRSSSVPRCASRKSTVVSVSDEGTAVGRNLEMAYHVERQPISAKASRILKELVVEKVDGDNSFFEIPLDESFKTSPKRMSALNSPAVSRDLSGTKGEHHLKTPEQHNSPMMTPISRKQGRSMAPSSAFKEPGLPLSAFRIQSASSRRRKTEHASPLRSPEEMVEILKRSPMVEMTRRKSKHFSNSVPSEINSSDLSFVSAHSYENHSAPLLGNNDTNSSGDTSSVHSTDASQEQYFRGLITGESDRLMSLCSKWNDTVADNPDLSDEVLGQIRSAIGKAQLLKNQRFKQFSGLVDNYAFGTGEKETTPSDLQGFWDMIYFQVEDVNKLFSDLDQLQSDGWQIKCLTPKAVMPKKKMTKVPLNSKKIKSNFAAFRNDLLKKKAAAIAASSGSENMVDIIM